MTETSIANEPLLAPYARKLLELNIRWIEQFLPYAKATGFDHIAEYLGIETGNLKQIIESVCQKYPNIESEPTFHLHHLGCGS
ncbi:MAG: hypothetical protein WC797_02115 [Candidatus Paceibacterota bacterium]